MLWAHGYNIITACYPLPWRLERRGRLRVRGQGRWWMCWRERTDDDKAHIGVEAIAVAVVWSQRHHVRAHGKRQRRATIVEHCVRCIVVTDIKADPLLLRIIRDKTEAAVLWPHRRERVVL
eukprot:20011-Prymnesium_polylepis.2